jgi:hypothetical protein
MCEREMGCEKNRDVAEVWKVKYRVAGVLAHGALHRDLARLIQVSDFRVLGRA